MRKRCHNQQTNVITVGVSIGTDCQFTISQLLTVIFARNNVEGAEQQFDFLIVVYLFIGIGKSIDNLTTNSHNAVLGIITAKSKSAQCRVTFRNKQSRVFTKELGIFQLVGGKHFLLLVFLNVFYCIKHLTTGALCCLFCLTLFCKEIGNNLEFICFLASEIFQTSTGRPLCNTTKFGIVDFCLRLVSKRRIGDFACYCINQTGSCHITIKLTLELFFDEISDGCFYTSEGSTTFGLTETIGESERFFFSLCPHHSNFCFNGAFFDGVINRSGMNRAVCIVLNEVKQTILCAIYHVFIVWTNKVKSKSTSQIRQILTTLTKHIKININGLKIVYFRIGSELD